MHWPSEALGGSWSLDYNRLTEGDPPRVQTEALNSGFSEYPRKVTECSTPTARWDQKAFPTLLLLLKPRLLFGLPFHMCVWGSQLTLFSHQLPLSDILGLMWKLKHMLFIIGCIYLINFISFVIFVKMDHLKTFIPLHLKKITCSECCLLLLFSG